MPGNILFALSLCRKAGALVMGFDAVKDSVGKGKAQLVLCAGDLSEGTRRRVGVGQGDGPVDSGGLVGEDLQIGVDELGLAGHARQFGRHVRTLARGDLVEFAGIRH